MSLTFLFYFLTIFLAFLHTIGEALYKSSANSFLKCFKELKNKKKINWNNIKYFILICISIGISLGVKVIYGVILVNNPLFIISGLFLACITIFSFILGKVIFKEQIEKLQAVGLGLIVIGLILLV